ncbi:polyhydroxyalkanoate synthesis repressor PhaR [Curvivirga sp.]|uniref:polyhydroxyalkanoate synthesis repressor PhaR n=1 Tax=Curvivirga sp. TaxID=2856848 RepID=UPI003B5B8A27
MGAQQKGDSPIIIKKYANRRLYNTATSSYVTLEHLCEMVKQGVEFTVHDAKSGDDITRSVLTQIIVEEESKGGQNLLPIRFLRQLISYYGEGIPQSVLPNYLEMAMENYAQNQEKMQNYLAENMNNVFPFGNFEEIGRQNMAMFEQAMNMFTSFSGNEQNTASAKSEPVKEPEVSKSDAGETENPVDMLNDLQKQLLEMQEKLANIEKK